MARRRGMAQSAAANGPPGRDIWISSGLRSRASGLRESPAFGRLDLFGIPWILSSEMSLFNGLQATWGQFYFSRGPFPPAMRRKGRPSSIRRSTALKRLAGAEKAGHAGDHGSRHREVRSGHWDQTNAAFAFLQGIVDLAPFYTKIDASSLPARSPDARLFNELRGGRHSAPEPKPSSLRAEGEAIHAPGRGGGMDCFVAPGSSTRGSLLAMTVAGCLN